MSAAIGLIAANRLRQKRATDIQTVAILQTASHTSLDAVRHGFMEELTTCLGNDIDFVVYNAQGSVTQAHTIAQQLHADSRVKAICAIGTPAAQAAHAVEKAKPIIIAAVTDPASLGLTGQSNICGVSDRIDIENEIDMLRQLVPGARTVGLLYSSGEPNSIASISLMRTTLTTAGLKSIDFAVSNEADIAAVVVLACRKVDVILAPTDNIIASTVPLISSITQTYKTPFIASHNAAVQEGALASRGVDYEKHGKHAAYVAYKVLSEGVKPSTLAIEHENTETIFINQNTMRMLNITEPSALQPHVVLITQGQ